MKKIIVLLMSLLFGVLVSTAQAKDPDTLVSPLVSPLNTPTHHAVVVTPRAQHDSVIWLDWVKR